MILVSLCKSSQDLTFFSILNRRVCTESTASTQICTSCSISLLTIFCVNLRANPIRVRIHQNEKSTFNISTAESVPVLPVCSHLVHCLRYHFAGLHGEHYERVPYRNHQTGSELARHVTRYTLECLQSA